jgi:hypothetical protein
MGGAHDARHGEHLRVVVDRRMPSGAIGTWARVSNVDAVPGRLELAPRLAERRLERDFQEMWPGASIHVGSRFVRVADVGGSAARQFRCPVLD